MSDDEIDIEGFDEFDEFDEIEQDVGSGWLRYMPISAAYILDEFDARGPLTLNALAALLADKPTPRSLTDTAWEPDPWTAEERQEMVDGGEELDSLEELNAEAERELAESIVQFATYTDALGIPRIQTLGDILTYAVACRYVTATAENGETRYELNPHAPLPEEVLPLTEEEQHDEDRMRWRYLNEHATSSIAGLFRPYDPNPLDVISTSLEQLARDLDLTVDDARAGLACLLEEPDFHATRDPETVDEHEIFEIRMDR